MATITFQAEDLHFEENYYHLFIEAYNPSRTNKEREEGWTFSLDDTMANQITDLCELYRLLRFEREAFCVVRHMLDAIEKNSNRVTQKVWDSGLGDTINNLDALAKSALLENIFSTGNLDYIKVKQKEDKALIKYEGVLLDFIRQAVIEKVERDEELLLKIRTGVYSVVWQAKDYLKPQNIKRDEKHYAYSIAWFFRDQLQKLRLDPEYVNKERIDEFGAELMKLAGFEFLCDESELTSTLSERRATFRSWRSEQKKYFEKYGLIP